MSLFVVVWLVGCVFVQFVGAPDCVDEITEIYGVFVRSDDLVESFTEISQVLEGPVV